MSWECNCEASRERGLDHRPGAHIACPYCGRVREHVELDQFMRMFLGPDPEVDRLIAYARSRWGDRLENLPEGKVEFTGPRVVMTQERQENLRAFLGDEAVEELLGGPEDFPGTDEESHYCAQTSAADARLLIRQLILERERELLDPRVPQGALGRTITPGERITVLEQYVEELRQRLPSDSEALESIHKVLGVWALANSKAAEEREGPRPAVDGGVQASAAELRGAHADVVVVDEAQGVDLLDPRKPAHALEAKHHLWQHRESGVYYDLVAQERWGDTGGCVAIREHGTPYAAVRNIPVGDFLADYDAMHAKGKGS